MADVSANPEKLRRLAATLGSVAQQLDQLSRQAMRSLEASDWKDSEKAKFESDLKAALHPVQRAGEQLKSDLAPRLQRMATALEHFRG